jgi:phage terminase small subunit
MTDESSRKLPPPSPATGPIGLFAGEASRLPEWARPLRPRQLKFVQEYLVDMSPRNAALRAGLSQSPTGASSVARNMLRDPEVRTAIDAALAEGLYARAALHERIVQETSAIAFYDIGEFVRVRGNTVTLTDTDELTDDQRKAVKSYKQTSGKVESLEVTMHDKVAALKLLDQLNGGSPRRDGKSEGSLEVSGPVTVVLSPKESQAV